jgi:integrase
MNPEIQYNANVGWVSELSREWYTKIIKACKTNAMVNDRKDHIYRVYTWGKKNFGIPTDANPAIYMDNLRHEPAETNPFTLEEITKIKIYLNQPDKSKLTYTETIVANIVLFLFATGMRPQEMIDLGVSDIVMDDNNIDRLIAIKGSKARESGKVSRYLFVTDEISSYIDVALAHRSTRTSVNNTSLWVSPNGKVIYKAELHRLFKNVLRKIGIADKQLYDLRRGCATNIIHDPRYGVIIAQKQLGHKDIKQTMRYENLGKREAARLFKGH